MTVSTTPTAGAALEARRSIYAFDPAAPLPEGAIGQIIDAGRYASSWANSQPWAFVILRRGTPESDAFARTLTAGNLSWVPRAGAVIVAIEQRIHDQIGPDSPDYAAYDLGQAMGSMAIEAHLLGLATHQFAGFDHAAARGILAVPDGWTVVAGMAVGSPKAEATEGDEALFARDAAKTKSRRPAAESVYSGRFGASA